MSVTSVQPGRPTPYDPISGNNSQSARFAALAKPSRENPATRADGSRGTSAQANGATSDSTVPSDRQGSGETRYSNPNDVSQLQSAFAQARRPDGATSTGSTNGTSESDGSPSSAGIALYERISQIGNNE